MDMRNLNEIAADIEREGRGKSWYAYAEPYVDAMLTLSNLTERYYEDSAESVVSYCLANLNYWRGDLARQCKAELKEHLAQYRASQKVVNA